MIREHPMESGIFVCVRCGDTFTERSGLEEHWSLWGHGPSNVQRDAIDRARWVHHGEPVPEDNEA